MTTRTILGVCLAAALSAPSLALAQNRTDLQMLLDLRQSQEQIKQLQLAINALTEQIKAINGRLDTEAGARNKGFADQQTLVNNVVSGLSALQGAAPPIVPVKIALDWPALTEAASASPTGLAAASKT